jgi:hypothetical protein
MLVLKDDFLKLNDYFDVGDLIVVFFISELNVRTRVSGVCVSKSGVGNSFEVFTKGETSYRFNYRNPNILGVKRLQSLQLNV